MDETVCSVLWRFGSLVSDAILTRRSHGLGVDGRRQSSWFEAPKQDCTPTRKDICAFIMIDCVSNQSRRGKADYSGLRFGRVKMPSK